MARIRTIKPEFFRHSRIFKAEKESGLPLRLAFAGLWTACDREGRFKWEPDELKLDCLPYDDIDFAEILNALEKHGFVQRYEIDGHSYGLVPSFTQHQVINIREAQSKIPAPEMHGNAHAITGERQVHKPGEGKGREKEGKDKPPVVPLLGDDTDFDSWWSVYPRRVGKGQARKAFKAALKKTDLQTLIDGVKRYAASRTGEDAKFTAHPASWLNAERWLDDFTAEGVKSESQVVRERAETDAHQATIRRSAEKAAADSRARLQEAARIAQERRECTNPPTGTPDDVSRTTGQI